MTTAIGNARIITPRGIVDGSIVLDGARIAAVTERDYPAAVDVRGAFVMPGIIDVHTDYLEREISPRPDAEVPLPMALHAMDVRALACGLTTVLSAARVSPDRHGSAGSWHGDGLRLARAIADAAPGLRARHLAHVRWDTRYTPVAEDLAELVRIGDGIGNVVFNDSLPGVRQFRDMDAIVRKSARFNGITEDEARARIEATIARLTPLDNRADAAAALRGRFPLGSHDDTTIEHVREAHALGATLCEMPVTIEAAREAKRLGMAVCMGAPNYVRGGSHCGNLSAAQALAEGLVDMLCSDYHFPSLPAAAVRLLEAGHDAAEVAALLAARPAAYLGRGDRFGRIEPGMVADLVAFRARTGYADVTHTWVDGIGVYRAHDRLAVGASAR